MALNLLFREANAEDLVTIIKMLANDPLGKGREQVASPLPETYLAAFNAIAADPNNELVVALFDEQVVGVLQLTFIPYLTYQGSWRALIEGVRVAEAYRSRGVGKQLFEWAIGRADDKGCRLVQLTTDKTRPGAKRFYEALGFQATHEGMKLHLSKT